MVDVTTYSEARQNLARLLDRVVKDNEPVIVAPLRGAESVYRARSAIKPGISCSANWISLRPKPARVRSATLYSDGMRTRAMMTPYELFFWGEVFL